MMLVDICQWRVEIGLFHCPLSVNNIISVQATIPNAYLILKLYLFCSVTIIILLTILPLSLILYAILQYLLFQDLPFLHDFAYLYTTFRSNMYISFESTKRTSLILCPARRKYLESFLLYYGHIYAVCLLFYTLHLQWSIYKHILLRTDIEKNPGPDQGTFKFCSWNLNSLCAYEFIRVSLIEAYNSIHTYDLIGIMETHLDSTIDESKLSLNGYSFMKSNHPKNVKRGGVGLYVRDSFPTRERLDLVTLPECIVCEIQLKRKKYFFVVLHRSPSQTSIEFDDFMRNFELMLFKMFAESPFSVIITGD